jgi:hypothetical protein
MEPYYFAEYTSCISGEDGWWRLAPPEIYLGGLVPHRSVSGALRAKPPAPRVLAALRAEGDALSALSWGNSQDESHVQAIAGLPSRSRRPAWRSRRSASPCRRYRPTRPVGSEQQRGVLGQCSQYGGRSLVELPDLTEGERAKRAQRRRRPNPGKPAHPAIPQPIQIIDRVRLGYHPCHNRRSLDRRVRVRHR